MGAKTAAEARPARPSVAPPIEAPPPDPEELFRREMADVRRLPGTRARVPPRPPATPQRVVTDADAEALAVLSELVSGGGPFDFTHSVEFVEGAVAGLDRRVVRRLRAGDFAYQSHLDLHGLTAVEAREAVDRFLQRAHQRGHRCVLIIHGRGHNSKDQIPVLKHRVTTWLGRGTWARLVLAFTSARPCDGGAGALYVLLRRRRTGKKTIRVTHGANW